MQDHFFLFSTKQTDFLFSLPNKLTFSSIEQGWTEQLVELNEVSGSWIGLWHWLMASPRPKIFYFTKAQQKKIKRKLAKSLYKSMQFFSPELQRGTNKLILLSTNWWVGDS